MNPSLVTAAVSAVGLAITLVGLLNAWQLNQIRAHLANFKLELAETLPQKFMPRTEIEARLDALRAELRHHR